MIFEYPSPKSEREHFGEMLAEIKKNPGGYIEYRGALPKYEFLEYLLESGYLLHGTSVEDEIGALEPRQANDASKKSGNQRAVYAVNDPILPLFYAIKDRKRLRGMVHSGCLTDDAGVKTYSFQIDGTRSEKDPWKSGVVHILPKESFVQTKDNEGEPTNEWISHESIIPVARLRVIPADFPYLKEVKIV